MLEWIVTSEESGSKLVSFLVQRLNEKYSARFLKRLIEQNGCQVNGKTERFASTPLRKGDHIILHLEHVPLPVKQQAELGRILYEDEALLVYDKPAGINCDEKGIVQLWKKTMPSLQLIHRLDRDTTGVLLLAKERAVFEELVRQFKELQVEKRYLAIVDGKIEMPKGKIENYLGKKRAYAGQTIYGAVSSSQGLYACTEWEKLLTGSSATLVACYPETGRTHQIRVHMAEDGHPVIGDFQYGKEFKCSYRPSRILLHAERISFRHPTTGKAMELVAPIPDDFKLAKQKIFKTR